MPLHPWELLIRKREKILNETMSICWNNLDAKQFCLCCKTFNWEIKTIKTQLHTLTHHRGNLKTVWHFSDGEKWVGLYAKKRIIVVYYCVTESIAIP